MIGMRAHAQAPVRSSVVPYEERLNADRRWALSEGSRHFENEGAVHEALRRVTRRLDELGIQYAVAGGMALFQHGYRRFTEDVDILVTKDGLKAIHDALEGRGYVPAFAGSKSLRDAELGVKVEFLIAGQYPGDGKPKPISFPVPNEVCEEHDGIRYLNPRTLVELKLASGMSSPDRGKDLVDVQELIKVMSLPADFGERLHESVRSKYSELWSSTRVGRRYVRRWRNKFLTAGAKTLDEMIATLQAATSTLEAMRADGVTLDPDGGTADDYAHLVTTDPDVARKYDMQDEREFWGEDEGEPRGVGHAIP